MVVRRTIGTLGILVTTLTALAAAPSAQCPARAEAVLQPMAAARTGVVRRAQASCGSDKKAAAQERREAAKAKREEAAQARREAAQERREAAKAKREEAHASAQERREAAKAKREEARAAAKSKREEAHAAALAKREERKAAYEEAKQRREQAAEERRERLASAQEGKRSRSDDTDDDLDTDSAPTSTGGFGTLRVNSRPWAQVYVDGQLVGHTPQLGLNVPAGEHNVRLVNNVFAMSKTFRLSVRNGERVTRVETLDE